jgi:hypothetical protein
MRFAIVERERNITIGSLVTTVSSRFLSTSSSGWPHVKGLPFDKGEIGIVIDRIPLDRMSPVQILTAKGSVGWICDVFIEGHSN